MCAPKYCFSKFPLLIVLSLVICQMLALPAQAQDTVTGAFQGEVTNNQTGLPISKAKVEIIDQQTDRSKLQSTNSKGVFYQPLLKPGWYTIRVSMLGYCPREVRREVRISQTNEVIPVPVALDPEPPGGCPDPPLPKPSSQPGVDTDARAVVNTTDARRSSSFTEKEVADLSLDATTLVGTVDELALQAPGVAPPPETRGHAPGPGVGVGVGSAGQFSVNGSRSRAINFTVDGSDNNDEDIGVRRQGYVALNSQPTESIKEYHIITLLAPAQFGRNIGAQVNIVSKSGGNKIHGSVYGSVNSSQLNARNFFDTTNGNAVFPLHTGNNQPVILRDMGIDNVIIREQPLTVRDQSGGEDSFTLGKMGFVVGGPVISKKMFYFISAEGHLINATKEESFAVPTVEQRGAFGSGATGIFRDPLDGTPKQTSPTSNNGNQIFSLFPFANSPQGIYGNNTFTQVLPSRNRGLVLSGKFDNNFKIQERQQSVTGRYNATNDWREIPVTGEALFSTLKPHVRTQNFSFFLNSDLSAINSDKPISTQVRLSYGRTRLRFEEVRDQEFLVPSSPFTNIPFLLNAPLLENKTLPSEKGIANAGPIIYARNFRRDRLGLPDTIENTQLGSVGQVFVAGFSPVGVDVFNFPQRRVNNTYQFADLLTLRVDNHSLAFGSDNRRSELNSDIPRNWRPLVTFYGGPRLVFENGQFRPVTRNDPNSFIRPEDLVSLGAASVFSQTLINGPYDASINLRFYQLNFFGQDEWRIRPTLSFSYGLRYEYNTPPHETNGLIERSFGDPSLDLVPGLRQLLDGRNQIFDPDRNNLAPRVSVAYSPNLFGRDRTSVFRVGYGLFYDQIPGTVVSQSRNVFPYFLTLNYGGLIFQNRFFNPGGTGLSFTTALPSGLGFGTLNKLDSSFTLNQKYIDEIARVFPSALSITLPQRDLVTPGASHYSFSFEQQIGVNLVTSAAYIGTQGKNLLRFTTPNQGPGAIIVPLMLNPDINGDAFVFGRTAPQAHPRAVNGVGAIYLFESKASSHYDALQLQVRGRFGAALQYQAAYTFSSATDDVSDVFELAGAYALPQNSLTFAGERGPANFDVRHRFTYSVVSDLSMLSDRAHNFRWLFNGLQIAGIGNFQTGQPFTVNSIFDVNLDGNLTDRLNTTDGLVITGDRRQPLRVETNNTYSLLAPVGQDGKIRRNSFRAGNVLELDLAVTKNFTLAARHKINLRVDIFNFINRANFGIPVRLLEASGFGKATSTVTPGLRVQFGLKYSF